MADYNVQMKQYNGTSFDNILPYASQALTLAGGGGATEIIAQARAGLSQIATGSYVGTGTYGESEKNSLNFDFSPKLLVISSSESKKEFFAIINYYNGIGFNEKASDYYSYNNKYLRSQIANNSISWYEQYAAQYQGNLNGVVYNYIAFG